MNAPIYSILVAIIGILVIVGIIIVFVWNKRRKQTPEEINYSVFFIFGVCWFPLGIVFIAIGIPIGYVFFALGVVYLVIGLAHRDKWKKN